MRTHPLTSTAPHPLISRAVIVYGVLSLLSIICLAVGDRFQPPPQKTPEGILIAAETGFGLATSLLKEVGIAGLIAVLLAITFERLSSTEFRKLAVEERDLAKQDVFYYVYGYAIPESIRDEINTQILQARFVREFLKLRYSLEPLFLPNGERFMKVQLRTRFRVRNLTAHTQIYPLNASLERAFRPEFESDVHFLFLKVRGISNPIDLHNDDLASRTVSKAAEVSLLLPTEIVVPPKGCVTIAVGYQTINHYEGVGEYFTFRDHTCEVDVQVKVPPDLDVTLCDFGGEPLDDDIEHQPDAGIFRWTCPTPMLRNQGIYLTWMPKTVAQDRKRAAMEQARAADIGKRIAVDHVTRAVEDPVRSSTTNNQNASTAS